MISRDSMRLESPAAQKELELLQSMKVGDTRQSTLFPALNNMVLEWTLTSTSETEWLFIGRVFGQPVYRLVIRKDAAMLTLDVMEGV